MKAGTFAASAVGCVLAVATAAAGASAGPLRFDRGAAGLWQKLQKLRTTASLLHTTAHPDDEHGGMLALMGRGEGARVALASLTRGEAGANAIGSELFDALGWIRAEELALAGRYYGLDELYFTRLADYGYSKRLDEAVAKWGEEAALRDLVHVVRTERPQILVSRFRGDERDGHGQHQFAGAVTREAFRAAGDPDRFPELGALGLRPWQPLALYAGAREDDAWHVRLDTGTYSPWLGDSFEAVAREGLSLQRSQTSGRLRPVRGSFARYYERLASVLPAGARAGDGFFGGIDTTIVGTAKRLDPTLSPSLREAIGRVEAAADEAVDRFSPAALDAVVPALARGLDAAREVTALLRERSPDVAHVLAIKRAQFSDALHAALGLSLEARAEASPPSSSRVLPPVVPGDRFDVHLTLVNPSRVPVRLVEVEWQRALGWEVDGAVAPGTVSGNDPVVSTFAVSLRENAEVFRPHIFRASIGETRYRAAGDASWHRGAPPPPLAAMVRLEVDGIAFVRRVVVEGHVPRLPYGHAARELVTLPSVSVSIAPAVALLPARGAETELAVEVRSHGGALTAEVALEAPSGLRFAPPRARLRLERAGEAKTARFRLESGASVEGGAVIEAVARVGGREHRAAYRAIDHRDLETRYEVVPARARLLAVDVAVPERLSVGYVMGVGDEVPQAIAQLGASVELLGPAELASGSLSRFDAVVLGTRAYAVRDGLRQNHERLLDYVRTGGNLVVLYNTPELDPGAFAPFPGELPASAEEVSEEDAPVRILAPEHRALVWPNRITPADFEGWVEQRGSKFWSAWSDAYTPVVSSNDLGQAPQDGGWLSCRYGEGRYTYFAYALHRQLPFGVPGAYRILANLLSLGREEKR